MAKSQAGESWSTKTPASMRATGIMMSNKEKQSKSIPTEPSSRDPLSRENLKDRESTSGPTESSTRDNGGKAKGTGRASGPLHRANPTAEIGG